MKHCIISLICNEYVFIKNLLPYYYKYFSQIIFVDYDIQNNCNSKDGSLEFIKNYEDKEKKITLLTNYKRIKNKIKIYNGKSMIDKQKMFAYASQNIKDGIDFVWGTDIDETFNSSLFAKVEAEFKKDKDLVSIELMWKNFIFNQYNLVNKHGYLKQFPSRICKHTKGKIYGHCNWKKYGKTKLIKDEYIYHFSYIGYRRCCLKLHLQNKLTTSKHLEKKWTDKYLKYLNENKKYVDLVHPGSRIPCINYDGPFPTEFDVSKMIEELNLLMRPDFSDIDYKRFINYINVCSNYLEFGCGGSTYVFIRKHNQKNIYVVESDRYWISKIEENLGQQIKNLIYVDINSSPNTYGRPDNVPNAGNILPVLPANNERKEAWKKYSDAFLKINLNDFNKIDLILIDGRFRVACCLKLFEYISDKCIIMFDDFKYRKWYHECLNYFEIIDECKNKESRMCILKKKNVEKPSKELIEKYEIDYR